MSDVLEPTTLHDALSTLVHTAFGPQASVPPYRQLSAAELLPPYDKLLAHHDHMTTVLQDHHQTTVSLRVVHHNQEDDVYTRFILLISRATERVVETGIAQLHLDLLDSAVRREVLAAEKPLGDVLIAHDVLRRIEPLWYLRMPAGNPMVEPFGSDVREACGRIGVIHCNHQPAIRLLEMVVA